MPDGNAKAFYPAYDPTPRSQTGEGNIKNPPQSDFTLQEGGKRAHPQSSIPLWLGRARWPANACSAKRRRGPWSSVMNDRPYQR
ncbi:hypothetical protein KCP78_21790 [Salmonella enterica subsp. enterica]|nr:hypothetical protein KCP78_21790 [Salmonella enterica subsp. enterica]